MAECTATFETGSNGNAVLVADPGSATAWNTKSAFGGNTIVYSNEHAYDTLAGKYNSSAAPASNCIMEWSTAFGTQTDWYGRVYLYATANPGSANGYRLCKDLDRAGNFLRINDTGTVSALDADSGTAIATTATINLNQFVRIEWHLVHSATVGQWEIKLFNDPDSETPTETATSAANKNTGASLTQVGIGLAGGGSAGIIWLDNIVAGATAYPGPVPIVDLSTQNLAPVIYGRGAA